MYQNESIQIHEEAESGEMESRMQIVKKPNKICSWHSAQQCLFFPSHEGTEALSEEQHDESSTRLFECS